MNISIITPSYNQGRFIERTIQSILSQNIPNLDYIVVDGGSSDNTIGILKKYGSQIRWLSEKDKGQTDAVNKGIKLTSGDIIGWLNSDDIYYPHALKAIYDYFTTHPEVDVIYGDANHIDENDAVLEPYYTENWDIERLKEVCYLSQPAVFFRRSVVERFGLLNENLQYCMDYEYWMRLALKGAHFAYIKQTFAGSRCYPETKTRSFRKEVHKEINDMLKNLLGRVPDRWLSNYAYAVVDTANPQPDWRRTRALAVKTMLAALHWNKWISKSLLSVCVKQLAISIKDAR
ncbi:MAG: glycosyltransferase family 2 protein [Gammaproteobacteria bacterium]